MGERTGVYLENDNLYIYCHWVSPFELIELVKEALIRGLSRWNDRTYLNRIIFSEIIQDEVMELTGYGLGNHMPDGSVIVSIDVDKQTVNGKSFNDFCGVEK